MWKNAPSRSKFFPSRVDPFSGRLQNNFDMVVCPEDISVPFSFPVLRTFPSWVHFLLETSSIVSTCNDNRHTATLIWQWICLQLYVSQREKTYLLTYTHNEDSNQPVHPQCLIRIFVVHMKKLCNIDHPKMRPVKILIRLCECAGWSESSLGAHVRRYIFWPYG